MKAGLEKLTRESPPLSNANNSICTDEHGLHHHPSLSWFRIDCSTNNDFSEYGHLSASDSAMKTVCPGPPCEHCCAPRAHSCHMHIQTYSSLLKDERLAKIIWSLRKYQSTSLKNQVKISKLFEAFFFCLLDALKKIPLRDFSMTYNHNTDVNLVSFFLNLHRRNGISTRQRNKNVL